MNNQAPLFGFKTSGGSAGWSLDLRVEAVRRRRKIAIINRWSVKLGVAIGLLLIGLGIWEVVRLEGASLFIFSPASLFFYHHPAMILLDVGLLLLMFSWTMTAKLESGEGLEHLLTKESIGLLEEAVILAERLGHRQVSPLHVVTAGWRLGEIQTVMARLGLLFGDVTTDLRNYFGKQERGPLEVEDFYNFVSEGCEILSQDDYSGKITPLDWIRFSFQKSETVRTFFLGRGVRASDLALLARWQKIQADLIARVNRFHNLSVFKPKSSMNRSLTAMATPILDRGSFNLTREAALGNVGLSVGREREFNQLFRALESGSRLFLLIGESGSGKSAFLEGLAIKMVEEDVPLAISDRRLMVIDGEQLLGISQTQASAWLLSALREAARAGNVVIAIEQVERFISVNQTLLSILTDEANSLGVPVILTTTPAGAQKLGSTPIVSATKITLMPPSADDLLLMIVSHLPIIEGANKVAFSLEGVKAVAELAVRFGASVAAPKVAVDLAGEAAVLAKRNNGAIKWVTEREVAKIVEDRTGIKVQAAKSSDEKQVLLGLFDQMSKRVIGQTQAIEAVAAAIKRARTATRAINRPIASFLFLGPTGVGKTEVAKATAASFFANEESMLRFDMSEYSGKEAVARLIGSGDEEGLLTEAIKARPFSLLLLDELEKATPAVHDLLLQLMDEGRITDHLGRVIDATNLIIVATSNAGANFIQDSLASGKELGIIKRDLLSGELRGVFKPELLNRFTEIVLFSPLTSDDIVAIAYLTAQQLVDRLRERNLLIKFSDEAIHTLASAGYDPLFGARPIKRVFVDRIETPLSDLLLRETIGPRDLVRVNDDLSLTVDRNAVSG